MQGGKTDGIHDPRAVLDTIPYSRVFYQAFPGAIITHRGQKYKVQSMARPAAFANEGGYRGGCTLAAYAKPTSARYFTRPLSTLHITVIKMMERVDASDGKHGNSVEQKRYGQSETGETDDQTVNNSDTPPTKPPSTDAKTKSVPSIDQVYAPDEGDEALTRGSLAGNGAVNVRRSVHGYKKLSPITRVELSRTEISLPPMEFDTFALWIDTEASKLRTIVKDYDEGVHALSHALLAVAPLFVPCTSSDVNCDHSIYDCTRVCLFDVRAGGAGTCAQLWKYVFVPNGIVEAAIDLMENCTQCRFDLGYEGGCPACLQFGQCLKFNQGLSRSAALIIGKRMLKRIQATDLYKTNEEKLMEEETDMDTRDSPPKGGRQLVLGSPRKAHRERAMQKAKYLEPAKKRSVVLGRATWPMDVNDASRAGSQVEAD